MLPLTLFTSINLSLKTRVRPIFYSIRCALGLNQEPTQLEAQKEAKHDANEILEKVRGNKSFLKAAMYIFDMNLK